MITNTSIEIMQLRMAIDGSIADTINCDKVTELDEKIQNSVEAFSKWKTIPAPVRGKFIQNLGNAFRDNKEELALVITNDVGKIKEEALGEVQEAIDICDFAVGLSRQLYGLTIASERPHHRLAEQWHPLGPVAIISAFNFPVAVWAWNAVLAIVCGNSVIWKPSEKATYTALKVKEIFDKAAKESKVPNHLMEVVVGSTQPGQLIALDERIPLVSATGSVAMGKHVGAVVGKRLGRTILELGGNNAAIVTQSANFDLALRGVLFSAIGTSGQRCTSLRRLVIHRSRFYEFALNLIKAYEKLTVGNPLYNVHMGPLIDESAYVEMQRLIKKYDKTSVISSITRSKVVFGGERVERIVPDGGYYVKPAIIFNENPFAESVKKEVFAPILYVFQYETIEEAIEINNCVPQGLSSAIFTQDVSEAELFCSALGSDCGIANVNIGTSGAEIGGAFGGEKDTGGGRESGSDAWKNYMRRVTNTINYSHELPLAQGIKFDL